MHRMEPPHERVPVKSSMQPVPHEIGRQQHDGDLRHDRKVVGPEDINGPPTSLKSPRKGDDQGDRQQVWERHLNNNEKERVSTDILRGGSPVSTVGQHNLVKCDKTDTNQRRTVGREGHVPSRSGKGCVKHEPQDNDNWVRAYFYQP